MKLTALPSGGFGKIIEPLQHHCFQFGKLGAATGARARGGEKIPRLSGAAERQAGTQAQQMPSAVPCAFRHRQAASAGQAASTPPRAGKRAVRAVKRRRVNMLVLLQSVACGRRISAHPVTSVM